VPVEPTTVVRFVVALLADHVVSVVRVVGLVRPSSGRPATPRMSHHGIMVIMAPWRIAASSSAVLLARRRRSSW